MSQRDYHPKTARKGTQIVLDLIAKGVTNPIELALLTNKSSKAVDTLARRHRFIDKLDRLPASHAELAKMKKDIQARVRTKVQNYAVTVAEPVYRNEAADRERYAVMTATYQRILNHMEKLMSGYEAKQALIQLRVDLEEAAATTAAKAKTPSDAIKELTA
jgi:hypothetical protein